MTGSFWFLLWLLPYGGLLWFLRRYHIWIFYYLVGAGGMAYILTTLLTQVLDIRPFLGGSVAGSVHTFMSWMNIDTQVVQNAPTILMVLVVTQRVGWTILQIGVESSGLLEMIVLTSLVAFYPGWSFSRRLLAGGAGLLLTWGANLTRMLLIAAMLHYFGKEVLVLAHTFLGKLIFFLLTLAIYWVIITLPTLNGLAARLKKHAGERA